MIIVKMAEHDVANRLARRRLLSRSDHPLRTPLEQRRLKDDKMIGHLDNQGVVGSTTREPHARCERCHVDLLGSGKFLIRQPRGAAALRPAGDDALTGFILSANNRRNPERFIRHWLVQSDTAQSLFSNRATPDEPPQFVRQTNAAHVPPIRPFKAISDIALYRIVVVVSQARRRMIVSERERCLPAGIMVSEAD